MRLTFENILTIFALIIVAIVLVAGIIRLEAERQCLKHGWKDARVTWRLECYCIREENDYEIVRSLREIIGESD